MTAAVAEAPPLPAHIPNRLLSADDLAEILSVPATTIRYWRLAGTLPDPVRIGPKLIRWDPRDIAAWIAEPRAVPG
jgi:predicted DNA-binding transcriptional regulator AlpA